MYVSNMYSANVLLYQSWYIMEGKHVKLKLKLGQIANRNKKESNAKPIVTTATKSCLQNKIC